MVATISRQIHPPHLIMEVDFHHEVLFYRDPDEFLAGTVPYLRGAIEAEEPALVAVGWARAEALKAELDGDASEVRFADMETLGRNPARIIPFWRDFVDEHKGRNGPLRGIGEPVWPGRSVAELDECRRHEQLLNLAFDGAPSWSLLCPYDSRSLDDDVIETAVRCHPFLARGGSREPNSECIASDPVSEAFVGRLPAPPSSAAMLEFDRGDLHRVRELVGREAERVGLSAERSTDVVTAASELAANSVAHGGGQGVVRVWQDDEELEVEVEDAGSIERPLVGRVRPSPTQEGGRGLWIANLLCDLVQIRSSRDGTTIRLRMRPNDENSPSA